MKFQFQIINLNTQEFIKNDFTGLPLMFESGEIAARLARDITDRTGVKHQPRRIVDSSQEWHTRERARFESGHYVSPHWIEKYSDIVTIPESLFVHVSRLDPAKIAFTQTNEKGVLDIQTQMRVGAFILEHGVFLNSPDDRQKDFAARAIALDHANKYAPSEMKIATSADEIQKIYENGPNSCMSREADSYDSPCHPVRVYGDSDLSLAYLFDQENNRATARALIWQAQKKHGRIYGDIERLKSALDSAGYSDGSLRGAKIRKIRDESNDCYVLPYIDGAGACDEYDENFLVITSHGSIRADNTNGLAYVGQYCDGCEETVQGEFQDVYRSRHGYDTICENCVSNRAFWCERIDAFVYDDYAARVDGEQVAEWIAEDEATYCEFTEEFTFDVCVSVIVDESGNKQTWRDAIFHDHGFFCRIDGNRYCQSLGILDDGFDTPRAMMNEIETSETESNQ